MQFKPDQPNIDLEKQKLWNEWVLKVDKIIDRLGKRIDPGIKETVVALNISNINTDGSCEGHLDGKIPYPWVDVKIISKESLIKKFSDYEEILRIVKERNYKKLEEFKENDPVLYEKLSIIQNYILKITEDLKNKIEGFLNEFYSSHTPYSKEGRIEAHKSGSGFRLEMANSRGLGLDNWKIFDDKIAKMSPSDKKEFLKNNQNEMRAFTEFLKNKFFNLK